MYPSEFDRATATPERQLNYSNNAFVAYWATTSEHSVFYGNRTRSVEIHSWNWEFVRNCDVLWISDLLILNIIKIEYKHASWREVYIPLTSVCDSYEEGKLFM